MTSTHRPLVHQAAHLTLEGAEDEEVVVVDSVFKLLEGSFFSERGKIMISES